MASLSVRNQKPIREESKQSDPSPSRSETVEKVDLLREAVLKTIRTLPVESLFNPQLKLNLETFISDQIFFKEVADFLRQLPDKIKREELPSCFEGGQWKEKLKEKGGAHSLDIFYNGCFSALNGKKKEKEAIKKYPMKQVLEGRIFTLKNALIAHDKPELILESQKKHKLPLQSKEQIQEEGAAFIEMCLELYLNGIEERGNGSFQEELAGVCRQLTPFTRQITKSYLREYPEYVHEFPEDPLSFRSRIGHNRHGLVAATVMEACLSVLGYKTRVMVRSDLEPKATLATAHTIVEVVDPEGKRYLVDPAYLQFHQDVLLSHEGLPDDPILILPEGETGNYVDKSIIPHWRSISARLNEEQVLTKIEENDQILLYRLHQMRLPQEIIPPNMEQWVRSSFHRVWDLETYLPVLSNRGFQEIFNGVAQGKQATYNLVEKMGIGGLTPYSRYEEIQKGLNSMKGFATEKNLPEALRLFAQLPKQMREHYKWVLELDPRAKTLDPCINAYFRSLCKELNPQGDRFRLLYGCSGADVSSALLTANPDELFFVDLTPLPFSDFEKALQRVLNSPVEETIRLEKEDHFSSMKRRYSGALSVFSEGRHWMRDLPSKLFVDLHSIGIDLSQVELKELAKGVIQIQFPWNYFGSSSQKRSLTLIQGDITKPENYPPLLKKALEEGIDAFLMKGAFFAPQSYDQFLPTIAQAVKKGGCLLTADKTWHMEKVDPDDLLVRNGFTFTRVESNETALLGRMMCSPFDPLLELGIAAPGGQKSRFARNRGTDTTYWTEVTARRKKN